MAKAKAVTIYGIKNCDTMKKARAWLDEHGVVYAFHDYKAAGVERAKLEGWAREVGWETLLNRAGRTFRMLPEAEQTGVDGEEGHRADARAAVDDQAAGAGCGRPAAGGLQARAVREDVRRRLIIRRAACCAAARHQACAVPRMPFGM